jgi:hypothetical protein
VGTIRADQVLRANYAASAVRLDFSHDWEFSIASLVDLDVHKLGVPLYASVRIPKQICLEDPLNATLVDCDFMLEAAGHSHVRNDRRPLNHLLLVRRWIPERNLFHVTAIVENLVGEPESFEDFERAGLQAVRLAGFQRAWFRVYTEQRVIAEAVSSQKQV